MPFNMLNKNSSVVELLASILLMVLLVSAAEGKSYENEFCMNGQSETSGEKKMTATIPRWNSQTSYNEFVWKTPNSKSCPQGWISLEAKIKPTKTLEVCLDHVWTGADGTYAAPNEEGAIRQGLLNAGSIKGGETRTFEVAAGPHEIAVGVADGYGSETYQVNVGPGQTVELICGNTFGAVGHTGYGTLYAFRRQTPGKYLYYIREVDLGEMTRSRS
jgi:hypothetical protein